MIATRDDCDLTPPQSGAILGASRNQKGAKMKGSITEMRIRMPAGLKAWIAKQADNNHRSMNSEIVWRLDAIRRQEEEQAAKAQK